MILPPQLLVIRQWIVDAIAETTLTPIPLERVVWSSQDFPDRAYPYALVFYTASVNVGISPAQRVDPDTDELVTRTGSDTGISITIVSRQDDAAPTMDQLASSYVRELNLRTHSFVADPIRTNDLAVRDVNVVPNVDRLQGRSQWESRAVIDITFGHAAEVTETPGIIEHAEVTGTTTPPTPSAPQNIPAP